MILTPAAIYTAAKDSEEEKKFIKWVDFGVPYEALDAALSVDIKTHTEENQTPISWIDILAYLASKYGGDFSHFKKSDIEKLTQRVKEQNTTIDELGSSLKTYAYFKEAYGAVLSGFVGDYTIEVPDPENPEQTTMESRYGLRVFSPIAKGYSYSHFDDFGVSRSYGYKRKHLGHDMMGSVGTPIIAIESGTIECVGWNQYGGWRIGIRSFDKKRYYYYAHLRKDHPYNDMYEGKVITAGDVIGYLGMTGYSPKENVNNINTPHLHYGLQLIFDEETQKDGTNQIWINLYAITKLLEKNKSAVYREDKEYYRKYEMFIKETED
ncbi:MAG: peptidoglycan DD-metalloendopeptidase family protein [Clostridia bacterium]|nr:peptidoglycan DD-metalloendopeptidase family protein [Clostridia bacterium]